MTVFFQAVYSFLSLSVKYLAFLHPRFSYRLPPCWWIASIATKHKYWPQFISFPRFIAFCGITTNCCFRNDGYRAQCQLHWNSISKHKLIFNHLQITVSLNFRKQIGARWKTNLKQEPLLNTTGIGTELKGEYSMHWKNGLKCNHDEVLLPKLFLTL